MKPTMGGRQNFDKYSPVVLLRHRSWDRLRDFCRRSHGPNLYLLHALSDTTVPFSSSKKFAEAAERSGVFKSVKLLPLRGGHTDLVNPTFSPDQRATFEQAMQLISSIVFDHGDNRMLASKL